MAMGKGFPLIGKDARMGAPVWKFAVKGRKRQHLRMEHDRVRLVIVELMGGSRKGKAAPSNMESLLQKASDEVKMTQVQRWETAQ